jgi:AraC family transcriptional regulator
LLLDTLSIKEIAMRLGFDYEHYFSRLFKQIKGMSPTDYREQFTDPRFLHVAVSNDQETAYQTNRYYYYLEGNAYR